MYAAKSRQNPFHSSNVHNEQKNGDISEDQNSTEMTDSVRLLYMEAFKRVAKNITLSSAFEPLIHWARCYSMRTILRKIFT